MNLNWLFDLRGPLTKSKKTILEITGLIFILAVWQSLALLIYKNGILPSPFFPITDNAGNSYSMLLGISELWFSDLLLKNTLYSIYLNIWGYIEAILIALPIGFLIGLFPLARGLFNRPINAMRFLPLTAVTGLFILWFGIYSDMKAHFLAFGIIVYLIPVVVQRIIEVEEVYIQTIKTLSATKWQTISKVFFPAVFSKISDDIRVLTAISWTYIIVAELLNNQGGLGALIFRASRQGRLDKSFLTLFLIIMIGMLQDKFMLFIDKKLFKHKYIQNK